MRVFVTGAGGYIGGSVAVALVKAGYEVAGLSRSVEKGKQLANLGVEPVIGDLTDGSLLTEQARKAQAIINAADSDAAEAVESILPVLYGTNKLFVQNSGSSIIADRGRGIRSEKTYDDESMKFDVQPEKQKRVDLDRFVLDSSKNGVCSAVVCPCLIYGEGSGIQKESQQIPLHIKQALKSGIARCTGPGENIWSTVHIDDLVDLYLLIIRTPPPPGTFMFAENGEISFRQIAEQIRHALNIVPPVEEWSVEEASREWGAGATTFALASNSRVRGINARKHGWQPRHESVLQDIERSCRAHRTMAASMS